jgi:hypothetical protein
MQLYLVESQALDFVVPREISYEPIQLFTGISEPRNVFSQFDHDVWAYSSGLSYELQLVKSSPPSHVIAGYNNLFLLDGQRKTLQLWTLSFEDGGIETVIIEMYDDSVIFSRWKLLLLHTSLPCAATHWKVRRAVQLH